MLMIDLQTTTARLTVAEIVSGGKRFVSNPKAFSAFMGGLILTPDILLDTRWQVAGGASMQFVFFQLLLHEAIPSLYDVRYLEEKLDGRFALRITRVGDFTVTALNRRVIAFKGLPVDETTGAQIIDAEIRPEVLMALCNEIVASVSEAALRDFAAA